MNVLIACEFSGIVRDAFIKKGHNAVSCDLLPTEKPGPHIQIDIREMPFIRQNSMDLEIINQRPEWEWNLIIAHPPCTHLAVSGAKHFWYKQKEQAEAIAFFMMFINAPIQKICVENPISIMSTRYRKPDQYIQPWQFGHGETKKTCLWLKGLPPLKPTNIVSGREARIHKMSPGPQRAKLRSTTYQGIADAMAEQWG